MSKSANPARKPFYERKATRRSHYETYIKGWRLRECHECHGEPRRITNCLVCSDKGQEWAKPDCLTDIEPLIGETLRVEVAPEVDLRLHIQSDRRAVKQFIATDDDNRDPRIYVKLEFGYDKKNDTEDWYVTNTFGGRLYLHEFQRIGDPQSTCISHLKGE